MQHQLCRNCKTRHRLADPCDYVALPKGPSLPKALPKAAVPKEVSLPKPVLPIKASLPKAPSKQEMGALADEVFEGAIQIGRELAAGPPVSNPDTSFQALSGSARQARWREGHRDRYNEYQRDLMRRRRASS